MLHKNEVFTDQLIDLDGNTFENCRFEGCILRYGGGNLSLTNPHFIDQNRFEFINGVDPNNNPLVDFLKAAVVINGGEVLPDGERPKDRNIAPEKDLG